MSNPISSTRRAAIARTAALLVTLALPSTVAAQVGHTPATSPYRDLEHRQELTAFGGVMVSHKDVAGVAYRGGPMLGARYQLYLGGPAYVVGRFSAVQSERTVIDPRQPLATRDLGDRSGTLLFADAGLEIALTGHKSWRGLVPVLNGGLGVGSDFRSSDVGGFKFGTPFALTYGAGIRWTNGRRLQVRLDAGDFLFRLTYPERYYREANDDVPAVLEPNVSRTRWTHNGAFTLGLSYLFGR